MFVKTLSDQLLSITLADTDLAGVLYTEVERQTGLQPDQHTALFCGERPVSLLLFAPDA